MQLNILHITTYLQGGAGSVIAELASSQAQAGHFVTVVASGAGEQDYGNYPRWQERIVSAGVGLLLVDSTFKRDLALHMAAFRSVSAALDCTTLSIIHTHAAIPSMLALLIRSRTKRPLPLLQTMHGWGIRKDPQQAATDVILMNELDRVVTPSEASRRLLEKLGVAPEVIRVIPNGIGPMPDPLQDHRLDRLLQWKSHGYRILACIGTVGPRKNQRLLVQALAHPMTPRNFACAFIGEGREIPNLLALAEELGIQDRVHFYGYQPDGDSFVLEADWVVLPSNDEGLPLTVLEAYRAGIPVICSDIPELAEAVLPMQTGLLFHARSAEDLARTLLVASRMTQHEYSQMRRTSRQLWQDRYTRDLMLNKYMKEYIELLGMRDRRHNKG